MALGYTYPALADSTAISNLNLINDQQWRALGNLSLRNECTVRDQLERLRIELVDPERTDDVRLVGWLQLGPNYQLFGCIDETGCLNT